MCVCVVCVTQVRLLSSVSWYGMSSYSLERSIGACGKKGGSCLCCCLVVRSASDAADAVIAALAVVVGVSCCGRRRINSHSPPLSKKPNPGSERTHFALELHQMSHAPPSLPGWQLSPDAAITGDVIVGFPGETEEQFQHTLDLMERVKFDNLNTFRYCCVFFPDEGARRSFLDWSKVFGGVLLLAEDFK